MVISSICVCIGVVFLYVGTPTNPTGGVQGGGGNGSTSSKDTGSFDTLQWTLSFIGKTGTNIV